MDDHNDENLENGGNFSSQVGGKRKHISKMQEKANKRSAVAMDFEADDDDEDDSTGPKVVFEAGQIKSVYVENFMCHSKMTVDFGKHVNFVTGQNGSGKSAIAAAIQLVLGGSGKVTGRSSKGESFIKEGTEGPALIRITLLNEGLDAYRPEVYGTRIIVEKRIFKGSRASEYRMISQKNKEIVTREKRELERVLCQFNIYVDNPCCVLTQEESKKFINGQEKAKYEFFLKATGLERTKRELERTKEQNDSISAQVKPLQEALLRKHEKVKQLQREVEFLYEQDNLQDNIRNCAAKIYWAKVKDAELALESVEGRVERERDELRGAQGALEAANEELTDIGNMDDIKEQINEVQDQIDGMKDEVEAKRRAVMDRQKAFNASNMDVRTLDKQRAALTLRLEGVQTELRNMRARAKEASEGRELEVREAQEANDRGMAEINGRIDGLKQQYMRKQHDSTELQQQNGHLAAQGRNLENDLRRMGDELRGLSGGDARLHLIHGKLPIVMGDIARTRFRDQVRGPLAAMVKMKEGTERMAQGLEVAIGPNLSAFVVTNGDDQRSLSAILRRHNCHTSMTVYTMSARDRYALPAPDEEFPTVADALVVEDDLIFNVLLDKCNIASTLLVSNEDECKQRFVHKVNGHDALKGGNRFNTAITFDGVTIKYRYGSNSSVPNRFDFKRVLVRDMEEAKAALQQRISATQAQLEEVRGEQRQLAGLQSNFTSELQRFNQSIKELRSQGEKLHREKSRLESELAEIQVNSNLDTGTWEQEEQDLMDAISDCDRKIDEGAEEARALEAEAARAKSDKDEIERRNGVLRRKLDAAQQKLTNFINTRQSKLREVEVAKAAVTKREETVRRAEKIRDDEVAKVAALVNDANAQTPALLMNWDGNRLALLPNDSEQKLVKEKKKMEEKLNQQRARAGMSTKSLEDLLPEFASVKADHKKSKGQLEALINNHDALDKDHKSRQQAWLQALRGNSKTVSEAFQHYLQHKKFKGEAKFDHIDGALNIEVNVNPSNVSIGSKDIRTLSGGERSFVTLCLLLALGHVIECPFRILDEYDVFMDETARKATLMQLQAYALDKDQCGRQFIIITPNNLSDVVTTPNVRIKRMEPPIRNGARGLQQQTIA